MPRGRKRKANTGAPDPSTAPDKETSTEPPASQTLPNCLTQNSEGRFVPRFSKRQKQESTQPPLLSPPLEGTKEATDDSHIQEEAMPVHISPPPPSPGNEKGGALSLIDNAKETEISTSLNRKGIVVLEEVMMSQNDSSDKNEIERETTSKIEEIIDIVPNIEPNVIPQNEEEGPSNNSETVNDVQHLTSSNTSTDKDVMICSSRPPDDTCNVVQLLQSPSSTTRINRDAAVSLNQGASLLLPSTIEDVIITCVEEDTNASEAGKEESLLIDDDSLVDLEAIEIKERQEDNITNTDTVNEPHINRNTTITTTSPPLSYNPNITEPTVTKNNTIELINNQNNITPTTITSSTPILQGPPPITGLDDRVTTIGDDCIGETAVHRLDDSLTLDDIENFVSLDFSEDPNTLQIRDTTKDNNFKLSVSTTGPDQSLLSMKQREYESAHKSVVRSLYPSAVDPSCVQSFDHTLINDVGTRAKDLTMAQVPSISPCKQDGLRLPDSSQLLKELINEMTKLNQYVQKCRQDLEVAKKQRASWLKLQHNRTYRQPHQYHQHHHQY
ncbi:PREDICTED: probable serine/threonine-protein kinase DDB_G0282963 [Amphimedon queenslandica]|uniref:Uncharacterized protein n=1 Tax=Amphimedon queenslandica TaxID=400682 RepID=A0A1X7VC24_AMPQE|nr:PREDICTED: probable serine/threonine-protein kinase DDB_G0282963 [Amphimedon queenslandica]|eukprot:XP_019849819.1 PREDICTED: probable serine/threonine-protein kinase DDB_G0282963 [Amphimedon queenslandica]